MAENQENENLEEKVEVENSQPEILDKKDSTDELEEMNDRYKRLFAEFENYKKEILKKEKV